MAKLNVGGDVLLGVPQIVREFVVLKFQYCEKCGFYSYLKPKKKGCPICGDKLIEDVIGPNPFYDKPAFWLKLQCALRFQNKTIGPTLEIIFELLRDAKFVNFATYSLDTFFAGGLCCIANSFGTQIKGVVGKRTKFLDECLPWIRREFEHELVNVDIETAREEKGKIVLRAKDKPEKRKFFDVYFNPKVHQKLLVIDGLICYHGSGNLTLQGLAGEGEMRNIIHGFDEFRGVLIDRPSNMDSHTCEHLLATNKLRKIEDFNKEFFCKFLLGAEP